MKTADDTVYEDNPLFVASLEKAMRVLSALADAQEPLSLADIARSSGLDRSATQRLVFTFRMLGYLDQDGETKRYLLAAKTLAFGDSYSSFAAVQRIAEPVLKALNRSTGETINLSVLSGDEVVYVLRFPSRHVVSVDLQVGARLPAYCTAPGRAILAFLEEEKARRLVGAGPLEKRTAATVTDPEAIQSILTEVRRSGYAMNDQEAFEGDISIAAPVLDGRGRPVAAVNAAVPSPRWRVARVEAELTPAVVEAAGRVSAILGYRGRASPVRPPAGTRR